MGAKQIYANQALSFPQAGSTLSYRPAKTAESMLGLLFDYTPGGTITGGTINQLINYLEIIAGDKRLFRADSGDLSRLQRAMVHGLSTGTFNDPTPTTGVRQRSYYMLPMPKRYAKYPARPVLNLSLQSFPSVFGASATVGGIVVSVSEYQTYGRRPEDGVIAEKFHIDSGVNKYDIPDAVDVVGLAFDTSVADPLVRYKIGTDLVVENPYLAHMERCFHDRVAPSQSPTTYGHYQLDSRARAGRQLKFETSAATAIDGVLFYKE